MKREGFLACSVLIGSLLIPACRKAQDGSSPPAAAVIAEINETAVSEATGVKIRVLKTESVGVSPVNRFYWIQVEGRPLRDKLLEISRLALDQIIAAHPKLYHSFTFHFASADESRGAADLKKCYARTTFLPEGNWQKVGRVPIDGYDAYVLAYEAEDIRQR